MSPAMLRAARRFRADKSGAAAIEFAIVASAFIAFVMGISYISIMYFNRQSLDWAVQLAARQAEVDSTANQGSLKQTIDNYLLSVGLPRANVTYSVATANGVKTGSIDATFNQTYDVPFVSTFHMTFASSQAVPVL
jgi:Flp pilus assembly protein TadG